MVTKTLRSKILTTLMIVSLLTVALAIFGIAGVNHVAKTANMMINERMPIMECSMRAQNAILLGSSIIDQVLSVQQYDDIDKIRILEGKFRSSLILFDMYIKAIIHGTESNEFKQSSGGLTYAQWERNDLAGHIIIKQVPHKIKEFAKKAILHHNHYIKYAKEVIRTQKKVLRLKHAAKFDEIKRLKAEQTQDTKMANHRNEMTNEMLKQLYFVKFMVRGDYYGVGYNGTIAFAFTSASPQPGLWLYDQANGYVQLTSVVPDGGY